MSIERGERGVGDGGAKRGESSKRLAAKVAVEWLSGVAVFAGSGGFVPVPLAHVVGALVGAAGALLPPLGRPVRSGSLRRWAVTD